MRILGTMMLATALVLAAGAGQAQISDNVIKIGVLKLSKIT